MEKTFFYSNNGLKLCGIWHTPNNKTDKAIVLAHGITVDKDEDGVFIELADKLCYLGFAVLRFDFSSHGESEGKSIDLTIDKEIKDLEAAVIEAKKQYPIIGLLGGSFGGGSSVLYVVNNQEKLTCLCLWNPVLNYDHTFLRPTLPWIKDKMIHMASDLKEKGWTTLGSRKYILGKKIFEEMAELAPYKALRKITIPTVIIHGDKDHKVPYEDSKGYVNYLTHGYLITIPNAEHGFHKPDETSQAIKETVHYFKKFLH